MPDPRFLVYTRDGCPLCDEFIAELAAAFVGTAERYELRDVDADAASRRRFGLKVPVLTCEGSVVCHGEFDRDALMRLLRA
ncbi:MAG: glutaredoxin family protein [Steroidobacteraceae bacterium]